MGFIVSVRPWRRAYDEQQLVRLKAFTEERASQPVDWPTLLAIEHQGDGFQLPYSVAAISLESHLSDLTGRGPVACVDVLPFSLEPTLPMGPKSFSFELDPDWVVVDGLMAIDGSHYSCDDDHAAEVDRLAAK